MRSTDGSAVSLRRLATLAPLALLAACGGGGGGGPAAPGTLALTSSTPANGAAEVARSETVRLTFSAPLDAGSVNAANLEIREQGGASALPATLSFAGPTVTIAPTARLQPLTNYVARFGTGLRGTGGEAPAAAGTIAFTTEDRRWLAAGLVENDDAASAVSPDAFGLGSRALAAWEQSDGTVTSIRVAAHDGSGWGAPQRLRAEFLSEFPSQPNPYPAGIPWVVADAEGNAFAFWRQQDAAPTASGAVFPRRVWVSRRAAGSNAWSTPQALSRNAMPDAQWFRSTSAVSLHATEGHALAAWEHLEGGGPRVYGARYTRAGGWSAAESIDQMAIGGTSIGFALAAAPGGRFVVAWLENSAGFESRVWLRVYQPGSGWGTSYQAGASGSPWPTGRRAPLTLALADDGKGWLLYPLYDGTRARLFAAPVDAAAAVPLGASQALQTDTARDVISASAAINARGDLLVVWSDVSGDATTAEWRIFARLRPAGADWNGPQQIDTVVRSAGVGNLTVPRAAIDARGHAVVLWTKILPDRTQQALAARFDGAAWRSTAELAQLPAPPAGDNSPPSCALGMFGDGRAVGVWQRWEGSRTDLWSRLFD